MNLTAPINSWRDFTEMMAPQQPGFDIVLIVVAYVWLACGVTALFLATAQSKYIRLMAELADMLYLTTVLLTLGGILLGYHITPATLVAIVGSTVTFIIYRHLVEQAERWLTDTESRSYMHAGLATLGVNGICILTLCVS
jgi:uncharacterized membrane protein YphA (DoxX/SURF4 family)